ncbi:hypothetical protein [Paenibacillus hamazuiensis]|uniref:hypothetical protein n=1 Tax=Paenibacillus hamazuiensis TaxID=2936508 RepID=UPI002010B00F|nr:hypothetical protein [Paenibacillus hamazuiensis]
MNMDQVVRWLGLICLLGGIARIGMTPMALIWGSDSAQELTFGFIACLLMCVGTIASYLVQSKETGVLGFIVTVTVILSNIVTTCMLWTIFVLGSVPETGGAVLTVTRMISLVGGMAGTLVFAFLTFRAGVFPRWVAALYAVMPFSGFLLPGEWFATFWGLAYVGMGYCIWAGKLHRGGTPSNSYYFGRLP